MHSCGERRRGGKVQSVSPDGPGLAESIIYRRVPIKKMRHKPWVVEPQRMQFCMGCFSFDGSLQFWTARDCSRWPFRILVALTIHSAYSFAQKNIKESMGVVQRHRILALYTARDFLIGAVFLYGYVYTAYKYGNPLFGRNDFFKYKEMVGSPFDFSATTAPFVLRQIPTIIASIFYKLGVHYDTAAVVDLIGLDQDTKRRFFALICSNALAVCLSFTILASYLRTKLTRTNLVDLFALFGIFAAWFYFPSGVIAPLAVGWGFAVRDRFSRTEPSTHLLSLLNRTVLTGDDADIRPGYVFRTAIVRG
jgi:hypothetical protein